MDFLNYSIDRLIGFDHSTLVFLGQERSDQQGSVAIGFRRDPSPDHARVWVNEKGTITSRRATREWSMPGTEIVKVLVPFLKPMHITGINFPWPTVYIFLFDDIQGMNPMQREPYRSRLKPPHEWLVPVERGEERYFVKESVRPEIQALPLEKRLGGLLLLAQILHASHQQGRAHGSLIPDVLFWQPERERITLLDPGLTTTESGGWYYLVQAEDQLGLTASLTAIADLFPLGSFFERLGWDSPECRQLGVSLKNVVRALPLLQR